LKLSFFACFQVVSNTKEEIKIFEEENKSRELKRGFRTNFKHLKKSYDFYSNSKF
jgi:hypothetical protein